MISQAATVVLGPRPDAGSTANVAPARSVRVAYLTDPPAAGTRMLAEAGVEIVRV